MSDEVRLPPLPKPPVNDMRGMADERHSIRYSAFQMQAYARQAVLEDRERQAALLTPVPRQKRPKALSPEQLGNLLSARGQWKG